GYEGFQPETVADIPRDQPVVVYCTVGYRSERIGEQLQALGFTQVYNLYGGIFAWKNQGFPVVDPEGKPTERVHTYNADWSQWLRQGEKVY
ncbi:MAG: rhodanese-like domain-containing protein, partial [Bacteroidetes bacterium]